MKLSVSISSEQTCSQTARVECSLIWQLPICLLDFLCSCCATLIWLYRWIQFTYKQIIVCEVQTLEFIESKRLPLDRESAAVDAFVCLHIFELHSIVVEMKLFDICKRGKKHPRDALQTDGGEQVDLQTPIAALACACQTYNKPIAGELD